MNNSYVGSVKHLAPLGNSDHVVLDIACNFSINVAEVKHKLNFSKGNYEHLRNSCNIDWSNTLDPNNNSVDEMWDIIEENFLDFSKLYIPRVYLCSTYVQFQPNTSHRTQRYHTLQVISYIYPDK